MRAMIEPMPPSYSVVTPSESNARAGRSARLAWLLKRTELAIDVFGRTRCCVGGWLPRSRHRPNMEDASGELAPPAWLSPLEAVGAATQVGGECRRDRER